MESKPHPVLIVGLMLALIAVGSVLLQREVAETMTAALLLSIAWAGIVGLAFLAYARPRRMLGPVLGGLAVGALIAGGSYYWFSVRDEEVDEDVVTAAASAGGAEAERGLSGSAGAPAPGSEPERDVALAKGSFMGEDGHDGSGTATVVQRAGGGRTLTFTDFDVDPGAAVEVWLTTGPEETEDRVELGSLKGNVGNQQYEIPTGADLNRHGTVMLYCTPFTVRIAVAELSAPKA